ncbi:MAG TPA: hypothetical protein VNG04_13270, partial [Candidatus Acidoferrum sp.]|nr:hypothetical protein [Candidatus Acidoferrum sp.]
GSKQVALGEVRSLIRRLRFGAHQHDLAREACVPESRGDRVAGRAAAGDQRSDVFPSSSCLMRRSDQARYPPSNSTAKAYAMTR